MSMKSNLTPRMGRILSATTLLSLLTLLLLSFSLTGCSKYDDDPLWNEVNGIKKELETMKSQISSLQALVNAQKEGTSITDMKETETGYTITLSNGKIIQIKHGTNGKDGTNGTDGKDGKDAPVIGIALDNGVYYWTLGGEWLTDEKGNKLPVSGITPQLKIENDYWYVSTDNGTTWQQMGKATQSGTSDSFFTEVKKDESYAYFTLKNGEVIKLPLADRLKIELSAEPVKLVAGKEVSVAYKLINVSGEVTIEVVSSGNVKARVADTKAAEGEILVKTDDPNSVDEYTKVVILATDEVRTAMATLTFNAEEEVLQVTETYEVDADAQLLTIPVKTNLEQYSITIEESAQAWLTRQQTRAIRTENEVFKVEANSSNSIRSAIVTFTGGSLSVKVSVVQQAAKAVEPEGPTVGKVEIDKLYGYGEGTTGGQGATAANTFHFDNGSLFCDYLKAREKAKDKTPAIIYLSGKFTKNDGRDSSSPWFDIKDTENLSIYGVNGFVMENVGFFLNRAANIIIRNIYIKQPKADNGADAISMQKSHNVWVDHCTFESVNQTKDYEDGSCDITHATYNVTVSWCHFIKTQKSCLVGHSNSASEDKDITATFHHNFYDLSSSRHPRVRFGKVHVYNNFFNAVTTYGVGSAYGAMVLVEDNNFDAVRLPIDICTFPAKKSGSSWVSNLQGSVAGYVYERGNEYTNIPADANEVYPFTNVEFKAYDGEKLSTPYTYNDFKPSYEYIVDAAADVPSIVKASAGTGKLPGFDKAPIDVNNGGMTKPDPDPDPEPEPEPGGNELANGWSWLAIGESTVTPSTADGVLTLEANGKFESGKQAFGYVYRAVSGDFVATVQIDSYTSAVDKNQSLAGLMLTPDPTKTDTDFLHCMVARSMSGIWRSVRLASGVANKGTLVGDEIGASSKPIVKLSRTGNECELSVSLDGGNTFTGNRTETIESLPQTVYIGVAVNSGNAKDTAKGSFSGFTLNNESVSF